MQSIQFKLLCLLIGGFVFGLFGCSHTVVKRMETTAYCGCGQCCCWERGSWKFLKLDFWNKYINKGRNDGLPYSGLTARGTKPHEPTPGLFSIDSLKKPWMIPFRIIFPWLWFSRDGTIAADTRYYKFGTRLYVPGYGYGVVEDRGSAIKGPKRLDLYYDSHADALEWGRQNVEVTFYQ
jgi:hypothetical protein